MKASRKLLRFIGTMSDQDQESLWKAIQESDKELADINVIRVANKLETIGEWEQAAEQWESIGRHQDTQMCRHIHNTIKERKQNEKDH